MKIIGFTRPDKNGFGYIKLSTGHTLKVRSGNTSLSMVKATVFCSEKHSAEEIDQYFDAIFAEWEEICEGRC